MFCKRCAYNLRGLATPICPECGRPFNASDPSTYFPDNYPFRYLPWYHFFRFPALYSSVAAFCPGIILVGFGRPYLPVLLWMLFPIDENPWFIVPGLWILWVVMAAFVIGSLFFKRLRRIAAMLPVVFLACVLAAYIADHLWVMHSWPRIYPFFDLYPNLVMFWVLVASGTDFRSLWRRVLCMAAVALSIALTCLYLHDSDWPAGVLVSSIPLIGLVTFLFVGTMHWLLFANRRI